MKDSEQYKQCPICKQKTFLMACCGKLITIKKPKDDKDKDKAD